MGAISHSSVAQSVTLNVLAALQLAKHHVPVQKSLNDGSAFDYIIVGGGTAGCVLARRLTENPNITVAVIETGPQQPAESVLPGLYPLLPGTAYDYDFHTEPDDYTAQLIQGKAPMIKAGRMLSGSSGLDPLYHIRSNRKDFQRWVDVYQDESWSYDQMLKYYIKSEAMKDPEILQSDDAKFHGKDGPVKVARQPWDANKDIITAFEEMGVKYRLDINDNRTLGVSEPILHAYDGIRQSTVESYLVPVQHRANLFIYTLSTATRVVFDDNNNAVAVEVVNSNNKTVQINARKEVIVSAGTMKSAQLLLLSGIGPEDTVESWGIDVVSNLPVGEAVRDQVGAVLAYKLKPSTKIELRNATEFPVPVTIAYKALNSSAKYPNYRALNLFFPRNDSTLRPYCSNEFKYIDAVCDKFIEANKEGDLLFTVIENLDPFSTGQVALRSADPLDKPWIYMGTFQYSQDVDYLGMYINDFANIANTKYFQKAEAEFVEQDLEYCNYMDRNTYEYWRCYGRSMSLLVGGAVGTCPLGPVLDSKLKVHGVQKLRVVDAASFPMLNSGQLFTDVVALAEKAADMIKSDQ